MSYGYNTYREYEFTAFAGSDLLSQGDTQLSCGDTFTVPFSATACITVTDNDAKLSGDAWRNEQGDDRSGQIADIEVDGQLVSWSATTSRSMPSATPSCRIRRASATT